MRQNLYVVTMSILPTVQPVRMDLSKLMFWRRNVLSKRLLQDNNSTISRNLGIMFVLDLYQIRSVSHLLPRFQTVDQI